MRYFWFFLGLFLADSAVAVGGMTELTYMDQEGSAGGMSRDI